MPCNCRVPGSYPQIAGQLLEFGTVEGELMASQNIVFPGELPSAEANPSKVCCPCPKLDHSKQSWIGVNLDVEEWKLASSTLPKDSGLLTWADGLSTLLDSITGLPNCLTSTALIRLASRQR